MVGCPSMLPNLNNYASHPAPNSLFGVFRPNSSFQKEKVKFRLVHIRCWSVSLLQTIYFVISDIPVCGHFTGLLCFRLSKHSSLTIPGFVSPVTGFPVHSTPVVPHACGGRCFCLHPTAPALRTSISNTTSCRYMSCQPRFQLFQGLQGINSCLSAKTSDVSFFGQIFMLSKCVMNILQYMESGDVNARSCISCKI